MLWKELSLHPFTDPARSSLFVRREVPQGQKCYVLDTALFLASGTLLDACLAFSKFLINKLRNGEPILGFVELSLLVDILLSILQSLSERREERERGALRNDLGPGSRRTWTPPHTFTSFLITSSTPLYISLNYFELRSCPYDCKSPSACNDGNNKYVLSYYDVLGPELCVSHELFHLLLAITLQHYVIL